MIDPLTGQGQGAVPRVALTVDAFYSHVLFGRYVRPLFTSYRLQGLAGVALLVASATLFLAVRLVHVYKGATYKCAVEGPFLGHSSGEAQLVSGSFSTWPLGRECTYVSGAVIETTRGADDAWILTGLTYGPAVIGLLLVIDIVRAAVIRRGRTN